MDIILVLVTGAMCAFCFALGAHIGQRVAKGEAVEMPTPATIADAARERREAKANREEADRQQDRLAVIMENIENYDGTGHGQRDVPRG